MGLEKCRIAFIVMSMLIVSVCPAESRGDDLGRVNKLISSFEDILIDSQDLAFFLVTHGYHAVPKSGYVEIRLGNSIYRLVPNGNKPGLCDIM
ncbi:MAG TPA: hypothetical protein PKK11_01640 [Methanothrix sp.]|nr:hypothetical protein [Methanothrix sp.]